MGNHINEEKIVKLLKLPTFHRRSLFETSKVNDYAIKMRFPSFWPYKGDFLLV